ncbi:MAG: efflux RND transporter periplasmic adaptor subunit [Bacteroidota bacterium]|nr:efflux RND transporter periplasmic adaptor subunit [Bacteroidota bacterium]
MKNFIFLLLCSVTFGLVQCKQKEQEETVKNSPLISDSLAHIITIDTVKNENIEDVLSLSGEVSSNDNKVVKIFPVTSGQVVKVNVSLGDKVKRGQALAVIKSADVAGNYSDLSTQLSDADIAEKEFRNEESLYKNGIASEKEYKQAEIEYDKAKNDVNKARTQIAINGGGHTSKGGNYIITAPADGFVVEKNINAGSFIRNDNNQNLFTISDMQDVWVWANVFETDIQKIQPGQPAEITTLAYPGKIFYGKVDQENAVLDPESKAMKIKIVLPNPGMLLKPQMFTTVTLANEEPAKALEIPSDAIISDGGKSYVVVYNDAYHVKAQEVVPLKIAGKKTYIAEGLKEGDKIISKNQIFIYNSLNED